WIGSSGSHGPIDGLHELIPHSKPNHGTQFRLVRPRPNRAFHEGPVDCNEGRYYAHRLCSRSSAKISSLVKRLSAPERGRTGFEGRVEESTNLSRLRRWVGRQAGGCEYRAKPVLGIPDTAALQWRRGE